MITLKKLKFNIECIGGKTKKRCERDLTNSLLKKSPEAKRVKGKKYYKEGYKTSARTHDVLVLNWSLGVSFGGGVGNLAPGVLHEP